MPITIEPVVAQRSLSLKNLLIADQSLVPMVCNPHAQESHQLLEEFMSDHGLVFPQFYGVNTISSFIFPSADLQRLNLIAQLICLLYYIDDLYGDLPSAQGLPGETVPREVLKIVEDCCMAFSTGSISSESSPLAQAFLSVHYGMRELMNEALFERIATSLLDHLVSVVRPSIYGWHPERPSIEDYIYVRELVSGAYLTTNLIEFAEGMYLSDQVISHPAITRLRQAAARIGSLTNDLFSYEKEVIRCNLPMNVVRVIEEYDRCNFVRAVHTAMDIINQETRVFFSYSENADHWDSETNALVSLYIQGLKYQLNMDWHWHISTPRYRSPESPFEELRIVD